MDSVEEASGSCSSISGPHPRHSAAAALTPVLASELHASVNDVSVSGFNCAGANEPMIGDVDVVLHALLVGLVIADEFVDGAHLRCRLGEFQAIHQLSHAAFYVSNRYRLSGNWGSKSMVAVPRSLLVLAGE